MNSINPPGSKLPAIWWHKAKKQYVSKIGWRQVSRNGETKRVRAFQTLGPDQCEAMRHAIKIQDDWRWTVAFFRSSKVCQGQEPYWLPDECDDIDSRGD